MKLVLFVYHEWPHRKNTAAIQRMCQKTNIEFEVSSDPQRIQQNDYHILLTCYAFVDPSHIPASIKIIYGPHFFIFPEGPVVGNLQPELESRCVYNCLSPWVKQLYLEFAPSFIMPIAPLPFGVDTEQFQPYDGHYEKLFDCIVYIKRRDNLLKEYAISLLQQKGMKYHIFEYGSYQEEDYKYGIRMSKFMLVLDAHESQGFALQEAMSCNVPLLVMDAQTMYEETNDGVHATYEYLRPRILEATSVPYWSEECGIKIHQKEQLSNAVDEMMVTYQTFTPRDYVLRTLSDEVCMKRILDYFCL
jgi:glycosyltransferase involved in cell wall biosynthesis